jgi:hypothetical protein
LSVKSSLTLLFIFLVVFFTLAFPSDKNYFTLVGIFFDSSLLSLTIWFVRGQEYFLLWQWLI